MGEKGVIGEMGTLKGWSGLEGVRGVREVRLVSVWVGVDRSEGSWTGTSQRLLVDCGVKMTDGISAGAAHRSLGAGVGG